MGDLYGKYTCHQKRGSSVVDYLIAPYNSIQNIKLFKVGDCTPLLSDHSPIMATIHLGHKLTESEEIEVQMNNLPKRLTWDDESIAAFKEELKLDQYKTEVERLLEKPGCLTVEEVNKLLYKVGHMEESQMPSNPSKQKKTMRKNKKKEQPWFDEDCQSMKKGNNRMR